MTSLRHWWFIPSSSLLPLFVACSSGSDSDVIPCPSIALPAIQVSAVDSRTRQPLYGITGTVVRADGYTETRTAPSNFSALSFAFDGLSSTHGTYDVKVTKAGYHDWQTEDVVVSRGACGVETVNLEAAMVPL